MNDMDDSEVKLKGSMPEIPLARQPTPKKLPAGGVACDIDDASYTTEAVVYR